jgi:DNA-binding HxlR family transcriptional regulator
MSASGEPDSVKTLCELVNHAHVVEVLDALSNGPITFRKLRSQSGTSRQGLVAALRVVAARGLVTCTGNGSWDTEPSPGTVYGYTDRGLQVIEALSRFSVWTALYDFTDAASHSWNR